LGSLLGRWLGELDETEFSVAPILLAKVEDCMGCVTGAGEEVEHNPVRIQALENQIADEKRWLRKREDLLAE
jgi:hypothetical protein